MRPLLSSIFIGTAFHAHLQPLSLDSLYLKEKIKKSLGSRGFPSSSKRISVSCSDEGISMDSNGQPPKTSSGEITTADTQKRPGGVVLNIPGDEKESKSLILDASKDQIHKGPTDSPNRRSNVSSPDKPPRIFKSLSRSTYSKPKSRFGEQPVPIDSNMFENEALDEDHVVSSRGSLSIKADKSVPTSPKTPLALSPGRFGELDEDEEIYKKVSSRKKLKHRKVKAKVLTEWLLFLCILGCLIISLTVDEVKKWSVWGLKLWRWCLLVLVTFSGLLLTKWLMHFVVLVIELNYLLKKKVLYFVYAVRKSVQVCLWLAVVLVTWILLFQEGVRRSHLASRILDFITWTIASLLISALLWLLKTLLLKILASSFHVTTFFDRIQEAIFHQSVLLLLSGQPVMVSATVFGETNSVGTGKREKEAKKKKKEVIDMNNPHQTKQDKVSAWTMKMLVDIISNSGLTTLSNAIDESASNEGNEQTDKEITNEEEAIAAAYYIFRNVARPGCNYIDGMDLRRFMTREEVEVVLPMIDVAEARRIDRKTLTEWVVKVFNGRKALAHALTDTKTGVKQLNKLLSVLLVVVTIIVWLLLTGMATTKVLVFVSSQLVVAAFMFGNTCKTIFEAIVFVFVMHPFDVGDNCVIDGVQMVVEEMNILTTVFLKFDNEKIYYPNSVLATKPISNYYRSPDMGDSLEFVIDFKTPLEKIGTLKEKIKKYLERNPQQWHPNHNVVVKEMENLNKIKMALFFNHTMNFQDVAEKNRRRTELVLEMKSIFEEVNIRYDLLPQEVHLVHKR